MSDELLTCPECGASWPVDDMQPGERAECPRCGVMVEARHE